MWGFMNKFFKIVITIAIIVVTAVGCVYALEYYVFADKNAEKYYKQATKFLVEKEYQNAYFNYLKIKSTSKYYPIALYRQAWCANALEDTNTAVEKYKLFKEKYPNSIFTPRVQYEYARNLFMQKKYDESTEEFKKIETNDPGSNYAIAANYYLGLIEKIQGRKLASPETETLSDIMNGNNTLYGNYDVNKLNSALLYWLEYVSACPNCRYTQSCIDEITAVGINLEQEAYSIIGKALFVNEKYLDAIEYLQKGLAIKYWGYLVQAFAKYGDNESARKVFEDNYVKNSRTLESNNLNETISTYVQISNGNKKETWLNLLKLAEENHAYGQDFILYNLALISSAEEKQTYATKLLQQYPTSNFAPEMSWFIFRDLIKSGEFSKALETGEKHLLLYKGSKSEPAVLFWVGKIYHSQRNFDKAKNYYSRLLKEFPDDYYAYRAAEMGHVQNSSWHENSLRRIEQEHNVVLLPIESTNWNDIDKNWITLAMEAEDLDILDDLLIDNKIIKSWILYKNANFATAAVYARDWLQEQKTRPDFSASAYRLAYPLLYINEISANAKKLNLDEYLILSLVKEESYFNKNAVSSTGARGLMQIMPSTASFIAAQRDIPYATSDQLMMPNFNLYLGCNYFDYIKKELRNSNLLAVAAYNGGPGSVAKWLENKNYTDFDEFVEDITYPETQNYVKKFYRTYWNYLNIYK